MEKGLVVVEAVREVGSIVNNTYDYIQQTRSNGVVVRIQREEVKKLAKAECRNGALNDLHNQSISIICEADARVNRSGLHGCSLEYANQLTRVLFEKVGDNFQRY